MVFDSPFITLFLSNTIVPYSLRTDDMIGMNVVRIDYIISIIIIPREIDPYH